jgi:glycosyltransferase involved in cell wall biosynthesis
MGILIGHPTGNPNSHHAALAHFEARRLEAFCVAWFPGKATLTFLRLFPTTRSMATRLERRRFEPLARAPKIQGRTGEIKRLMIRAFGKNDEKAAYEANDWLMRTMTRECYHSSVTAVHAYEDCALWQFEEATRRGKACIYDMPIGYYPAWQETEANLAKVFVDWLPSGGLPSYRFVRPEQKKREMELADVVFVPSSFVEKTITSFIDKRCVRTPYGVDSAFWKPAAAPRTDKPLRFIYAGQLSIRKGTPILLQAWRKAGVDDAELLLVGSWLLADNCRRYLDETVKYIGPCSASELVGHYQSSDILVFPSFFEGFGLVLLEAMSCGLAVLASDSTAAPDLIDSAIGQVLRPGDVDEWAEALRAIAARRHQLPQMKSAARLRAGQFSWVQYRAAVSNAFDMLGT